MESSASDELVSILADDLDDEHRKQIDRVVGFRLSLQPNAGGGWVGSDAELTSALAHTKTLMDFYRPVIGRATISDRAAWWVSPFPDGELPAPAMWRRAMGGPWERLEAWRPVVTAQLGHLGSARRHLEPPEWSDDKGQVFDLVGMVDASTAIIGSYAEFLRAAGSIPPAILDAMSGVAAGVCDHWATQRRRLPVEDRDPEHD